jgi:two-component system sensor histidine kinase YesM
VLITAGEDDQGVYFRIEDNGRGMETVQSAPGRERGGIRNVHDRIQLYFGERYGVELRSAPGQGTSVMLRVPKLTEEPAPNIRGETA